MLDGRLHLVACSLVLLKAMRSSFKTEPHRYSCDKKPCIWHWSCSIYSNL
jgi:hypothetical protein